MNTLIGILVGAILFLIFERKRLQRLLTRWRVRPDDASARVTTGGVTRSSPRGHAVVEFHQIMLADVSAADQAVWITAALADPLTNDINSISRRRSGPIK